MSQLPVPVITIGLLLASNIFMTFAWYGHLKFKTAPLLAVILTATPGTAWLEHEREAGTLLLHVFDMVDEEEWRVLIRDRYEALLMESFA